MYRSYFLYLFIYIDWRSPFRRYRLQVVLHRRYFSMFNFHLHESVWNADRVDGFDFYSGLTLTGNQKAWSHFTQSNIFSRRKFFVFVMTMNIIGLSLTISGTWTYPRRYTSAFVLGNLLMAILVRNELFGRFLYLFVNTLFAKVGTRYLSLLSSILKMTLSGLR